MAISKIKLGSANAVELRDDASLHYIGHLTSGITNGASAAVITTDKVTDYTVKENDFLTYGTENLNYACTAIASTGETPVTWTLISEATAANALSNINVNGRAGTVANHIASVTTYAHDIPLDASADATTNNKFVDGIMAVTQSTTDDSAKIATTEFVHDLVDGIANPMIFKGGATIGADGSVTVIEPSTATDIKEGFTYKITDVTSGYEGDLKVGDTIIANTDEPDMTEVGSDWTIIPTADDVDVTSVGASGVGIITDQTNNAAITSTGSIGLKLISNTPLSGTVTAATGTYRTLPVGVDTTNGNLATAVPAGTLAEVLVNSAATGTAVASISNTGTTGTGAGAFLAAHVGDPEAETPEDADTLYIDYITPVATTANVVTYTAPNP